MKTTENNILIADFLQLEKEEFKYITYYYTIDGCTDKEGLKYHYDWNWLMEVVEKIDSLKTPILNNPNLIGQFEDYEFNIQNKHVIIYAHGEVTKEVVDFRGSQHKTKKEAVHNACVEFIKWYNSTHKK